MGICSCMSTKWLAIHCLQIALEFKSVDFCEGNKTGEPGAEKNPRSKDNNQQQTQQIQPKYDAGSGNPMTHWRKASALTTSPFLALLYGKRKYHLNSVDFTHAG